MEKNYFIKYYYKIIIKIILNIKIMCSKENQILHTFTDTLKYKNYV